MRAVRLGAAFLAGAIALGLSGASGAETVRFAQQYGVGYLPLMVMRHNHLIQKYAAQSGIHDVKITWSTFGGGAAMNAALLSGNLDFASGGVGPLLKIWDKTQGIYDVHGVAALNSLPNLLNTTNPNVHSIADFTDKDRIALPAVKVSIQAITLQMAAAKEWGDKHYDKLDHLTVSMKHPDAMAALLSGGGQIDAHFTSPPYSVEELADPKVHTVLSSYQVLGGKSTFNTLWASAKYRKEHPKMFDAVFKALQAADRFIKAHPEEAAQIYIEEAHSKLPKKLIVSIITNPENEFTTTPKNIMKYADFMYKTGSIKHLPKSWKDVFFKNVWNEPGS
ncbi:ABC-type nitrate/sulfonate/bicarbonate transport system, periplasmic component [Acidihalobacter prosperus]|uniref:ABC-type nitrate/sulfonate/bicarbonate transport system, periplasmic component n=2 Tax=Acidihalobacter prosperus TaxID=160660 RepID=A0A1A6C8H1_9GAMM|nr:ABC-type nitrate/sulfonate/bicarbonate transport system, periplasmic component [Acidihalobacter prosperus]